MKKFAFLFFAFHFSFFTFHLSNAQGCLPEGIYFHNQTQIDSFQVNYPGCTEIEGDVIITDLWWDITNLNGLNVLTTIGGGFSIRTSVRLINLAGMENLTSIGGELLIGNDSQYGPYNDSLTSLSGLDNLASIGGDLTISKNVLLTSLTGLDNLSSISGDLIIEGNYALTSLIGLDNINPSSIENLKITNNTSLSNCEAQSICSYLVSPNGTVDIYNNSSGCNNPTEVANGCGITLDCLPFGNYYFFSQADIDNFQTNFPGCADLQGTISITGNDITNLEGLNQVANIEGNLKIGCYGWGYGEGNPILADLSGLENLLQVGGSLWITHNNYSLISLEGIENLNYIGGDLWIGVSFVHSTSQLRGFPLASIESLGGLISIGGELNINGTALTNLSGLENLTSIGGALMIYSNDSLISLVELSNLSSISRRLVINYNDNLASLTGLENINPDSVKTLWILDNPALSNCEVKSICESLALSDSNTWIQNNAPGCNSQEEVEAACLMGVPEESAVGSRQSAVVSYPNPTSGIVNFQFTVYNLQSVTLKIYNAQGQGVAVVLDEKLPAGEHTVSLDASGLPAGVYYYQLRAKGVGQVGAGKIAKY